MHFVAGLCVCLIAGAVLAGPARAQDTDDWLRLYAVTIYRTGHTGVFGNGVYLGNGVVLTAAHVAGLGIWREPRVGIAGENLPTKVLKDGHFHRVDLELLSIDTEKLPVSLALRRMPLCKTPHWIGEPVIVATPDGVARSSVMSPRQLPRGVSVEFQTVIKYVAETGNSGSGVFDAYKKCLRGIITRKITRDQVVRQDGQAVVKQVDVAKYFVPASTIAGFIPASVRF